MAAVEAAGERASASKGADELIERALLKDDAKAHGVRTLVELLDYRAALQPTHTVFRFLNGDGREDGTLTFALLQQHARAIAARLAHHVVPGDRVLLLVPPGLDYVAARNCAKLRALVAPAR